MTRNRRKNLYKGGLIVLIVSGLLFAHFYAPRFITEIRNPLVLLVNGKNDAETRPRFKDNLLEGKFIKFKSFDGAELSSYLTYASTVTVKGTVILLHGIRSNNEHFIGMSKELSLAGYNAVALDSRAHGESGGTHCTYGVKERQDISELVTVLLSQDSTSSNIGLWGQSLGLSLIHI